MRGIDAGSRTRSLGSGHPRDRSLFVGPSPAGGTGSSRVRPFGFGPGGRGIR
jgi:hypothetical protein